MSKRWKEIQQELMDEAMNATSPHTLEQDEIVGKRPYRNGNVVGDFYFDTRKKMPNKAVVVGHGLAASHEGCEVLCLRLAAYGYFVLSIDLPGHHRHHFSKFSLGKSSEALQDAVVHLRKHFRISRVSLVCHSISAVAGIFATMGYTHEMELQFYRTWDHIRLHWNRMMRHDNNYATVQECLKEIDKGYEEMKQVLYQTLRHRIKVGCEISSLVAMAPPTNSKKVFPGMGLLRRCEPRRLQRILDFTYNKLKRKAAEKEGFGDRIHDQDPDKVTLFSMPLDDHREFLDYFSKMREPSDFMSLIEAVVQFKREKGKVNLFEYFQRRHMHVEGMGEDDVPAALVPKLFIYGKYDRYLRAAGRIFKGKKKRLEEFYRSCGKAEIWTGDFSHIVNEDPKQQVAFMTFTNVKATERIIQFLDRHT